MIAARRPGRNRPAAANAAFRIVCTTIGDERFKSQKIAEQEQANESTRRPATDRRFFYRKSAGLSKRARRIAIIERQMRDAPR
ncbi:hypothetical protein WS70_14770 [Burkholderia mayonis]|uniref:Uncharacterized protein n=1 Tax=Burkholderia mayonis TaxID=1385591 RepID=A0A1B4FGT8_9BURK|nr:hypothetical protein WS70_14770 [Burkholderia mayonis]KVE38852.1 hypothetical protein WS69_00375 [Burkholderia sp. BDU5]KVE48062.1 hypothetical protein WS70_23150 [Burkholderia mayonis]